MELNKYAIAALFSGLILSPTAVLAFGATVHTNPNVSSGEVSAEEIARVKAGKKLRPTLNEVRCNDSALEKAGCSGADENDADENNDDVDTISN